MTRPLEVVALNGSYHIPSKTDTLVSLIADAIAVQTPMHLHTINVATLGTGFTDALTREELSPAALEEVERFESADAIIAASPVYRGTYSGLFKHFLEFVGQYALANRLVLLAATAGSERHQLMVDQELRPLFGFFQAATAPVGVFASAGDFAGTALLNPEVYGRIELAVGDISGRLRQLSAAPSNTCLH